MPDLDGRHVHGDADMVGPARGGQARLLQHPSADRDDQAGGLGERDEVERRYEAARRMTPTDQRLETVDATVPRVDHGLELERELVPRQRVA